MRAFGLYYPGIDGVDADFLRSEFTGKHAGDCIQCAFSAGVNNRIWRGDAADAGANIDNARAFAKMFDRRLRGKNHAEYIDVEHLMKLIFGGGLDGYELV